MSDPTEALDPMRHHAILEGDQRVVYREDDAEQLSLDGRLDPAERAPLNKDEHIRQLSIVAQRQAERIEQLTSSGRRMTQEELDALVHLAEQPQHSFRSCPPGSGKTCKHLAAVQSVRPKMKSRLK